MKRIVFACLMLSNSLAFAASKEVEDLTKINVELIELNKRCAAELEGTDTAIMFEKGASGRYKLEKYLQNIGYSLVAHKSFDFHSSIDQVVNLKGLESLAKFIEKEINYKVLVDYVDNRILIEEK
jgi:hypothetical protein